MKMLYGSLLAFLFVANAFAAGLDCERVGFKLDQIIDKLDKAERVHQQLLAEHERQGLLKGNLKDEIAQKGLSKDASSSILEKLYQLIFTK